MIGIILADKIKSILISKILRKSCKLALGFYMFAWVVRFFLYLSVHSAILDVDVGHEDKGLGSYMAEYVDDTTGSVILTIVLLSIFALFYGSQFWAIKTLTKMIDFMKS